MSERKVDTWPAIGIDLGTKYSCVGVWQNGCIEIITNDQGSRKIPSLVAFTNTVRLIGEAAVNQGRVNPTNTILNAKRLIGRTFNDERVQKDMRLWPFKVIPGFGEKENPMVVIRYKGEDRYFTAEEISAMILMKMKDSAEAYLNLSVENAVVTVPAYFNDSQRQATKDACAIAGLNVLHILNEPTAAAIAYGFDNNMLRNYSPRKNVLIFDLGGGTFDVSLISIENGIFTVQAVGGNTHLGGTDFDNNMVDYFVEEFKRKHNKHESMSFKALGRLRAACEKAKRALSILTEATVEVDCLSDGIDFCSSISRACFDDLNTDLFVECIQIVEGCLKDARFDESEVDDILLVGGSTRIPKVQQLLREFFDGKELCKSVHPNEAVAYGAAVHAATLSGVTNDKKIVLSDVTPLSLRAMVDAGNLSLVIPRNTTIPTRHVFVIPRTTLIPTRHARTIAGGDIEINMYGDTDAHPTSLIKIFLYQGEGLTPEENILLGVIDLEGSRSTGSQSSVNVWFEIDVNGILNISAEDTHTGYISEITIINRSRLTNQDVDIMMNEAKGYKAQDTEYDEMVKAKNTLENYANEKWEMIIHLQKKDSHNKVILKFQETLDWLHQNSRKVYEAAIYQERLEGLEKVFESMNDVGADGNSTLGLTELPSVNPSRGFESMNDVGRNTERDTKIPEYEGISTLGVTKLPSVNLYGGSQPLNDVGRNTEGEKENTECEGSSTLEVTELPFVNPSSRYQSVNDVRRNTEGDTEIPKCERISTLGVTELPSIYPSSGSQSLNDIGRNTKGDTKISECEGSSTLEVTDIPFVNPSSGSQSMNDVGRNTERDTEILECEGSSTSGVTKLPSVYPFSGSQQSAHTFSNEEENSTTHEWIEDTEKYKAEKARYERKLMAMYALENYAYKKLELLSNNKQRIRIEDMIKIKDEINSVVDWLNRNNDLKDASNYEKKLKALQNFCGPIIASSSKSLISRGLIEVVNIIGRPFHKRNSQEETIKLGKGNIHEKEIEAKRKEYNLKMANLGKIVEEKLAQLRKTQGLASSSNKVKSDEENLGDPEFVQYDFATLKLATRYFSVENKLGQGGFGTVYKGTLLNGEILAIKRLSATGGQGTKEFMTEARLLAKLQHRNLVKLMGFCSEGEEKLLVYEFMANSSLDSFLFDPRKRQKLDWKVRRQIIIGIARGLQYLHEDSRLTIIHRDLKPANILLDKEMNTKIADFGVAKLFEGTQKVANTTRVVGTQGYMAPEYIQSGEYSNKTDVYSFGIMLLEIVSGQRNRAPHNKDLSIRTWELWNERRSFEIADPMLVNNCSREEVMRSIQIGLLCVQPNPEERPTMSEVVLMLVADVDIPLQSPLAAAVQLQIGEIH